MSGAGRRVSKGTSHPASAHPARPPDKADKPAAADKRPPAKPAPRPAQGSPQARGKRAGGAPPAPPADDSRQDAIAEAQMLEEAVADNDEGNNKTIPPASPPHVPRKADSTVTLELNKVQAERAMLQAETVSQKGIGQFGRKKRKGKKELLLNQRLLLSKLSDRGGVQFCRAQLFLERGMLYVLQFLLFNFGYIIMTP
jgi:hypothetical protein